MPELTTPRLPAAYVRSVSVGPLDAVIGTTNQFHGHLVAAIVRADRSDPRRLGERARDVGMIARADWWGD
ncbi:MAG TPA: hypothetical protein VFI28_09130 [Candidatus Limnocylindrales bacterium]|nr:hypothetical protein [Candidatus Limnocylindrales bacterium]